MIVQTLAVVIAVEAITEIIVASYLFQNVRESIALLATPYPPPEQESYLLKLFKLASYLINCGYCSSVWVAFGTAWVLPPLFEIASPPMVAIEYLIRAMVVHRLSNWLHVGYSLFMKGRVDTRDYKIILDPVKIGDLRDTGESNGK